MPRMNAYAAPLPGLFESGSRSRVFPNANIIAYMLRCNVNLLIGMSAVAGSLGFVAMLFGLANGVWIVLLASLPILWARLFGKVSPVSDNRLCGQQSDPIALASLAGGHFEKRFTRRVTDRVIRASAVQGNLF